MPLDILLYGMISSHRASSGMVFDLMTTVTTLSITSLDRVIFSLDDFFLAGAAAAAGALGAAGCLLHPGRSLARLLPPGLLLLGGALAGLLPPMVMPC